MKKVTAILGLVLMSSTVFAMSRTERNTRAIGLVFKDSRILELESKAMLKTIDILGSDSSKVTLKLTYLDASNNTTCTIIQPVLLPETENIMLGDVMQDTCQ